MSIHNYDTLKFGKIVRVNGGPETWFALIITSRFRMGSLSPDRPQNSKVAEPPSEGVRVVSK